MSVFFVKTSDMNPVVKLVTVEGVKMNISDVYDRIEEMVDRELSKFNNAFFEVFDDELTSKGWIVIENGALENELEVLQTVKDTIGKIKGVEIVIDEMPTIPIGIYNYEFEIKINGVFTPKKSFKGDNMEISKLYDTIEETIDEELKQYKNTFFEVFDDETTSNGRIYINTNIDEDDVLPIVKRILKQFPMVKVTIADTPSISLGYYFYGFTISIIDDNAQYWEECEKEEQNIRDMAQFECTGCGECND